MLNCSKVVIQAAEAVADTIREHKREVNNTLGLWHAALQPNLSVRLTDHVRQTFTSVVSRTFDLVSHGVEYRGYNADLSARHHVALVDRAKLMLSEDRLDYPSVLGQYSMTTSCAQGARLKSHPPPRTTA